MSVLGAFADDERIDAIRRRHPNFDKRTPIPDDLRFWPEQDIERFFSSSGDVRPKQVANSDLQTCTLLTRIRLKLAAEGISEATAEYRSMCRYLKDSRGAWRLPSVASCQELKLSREQEGTGTARGPCMLERPRGSRPDRDWNMSYLERNCETEVWMCYARTPAYEDDMAGIDTFEVAASMAEYAEYVRTVNRVDRKCLEENIVAYPRVALEAHNFGVSMREAFDASWQDLGPKGVEDLTAGFLERTTPVTNWEWREHLRLYYRFDVQATGTMTRLHTESCGAHIWLNQIEGRRVFFLFSPEEDEKLYAMPMRAKGGLDARASPVDFFFPSAKRHPKFSETKCQVATLYLGQTLVIPSGWWWCSVAIEPSVTLCHQFWNSDNRRHFSSSLWRFFDIGKATQDDRERLAAGVAEVHRMIMGEDDSDLED